MVHRSVGVRKRSGGLWSLSLSEKGVWRVAETYGSEESEEMSAMGRCSARQKVMDTLRGGSIVGDCGWEGKGEGEGRVRGGGPSQPDDAGNPAPCPFLGMSRSMQQ